MNIHGMNIDDVMINKLLILILEILVIINARNLGWDVFVKRQSSTGKSELVLTKPIDAQTGIDRDTNALLQFLSSGMLSGNERMLNDSDSELILSE